MPPSTNLIGATRVFTITNITFKTSDLIDLRNYPSFKTPLPYRQAGGVMTELRKSVMEPIRRFWSYDGALTYFTKTA